jgi:hypothetical protein
MRKLCVVDMNFTWPPDGGAPVELLPVLKRYSRQYETTLLIPRMTRLGAGLGRPWPLRSTKFFLRGQYDLRGPLPFRIETVDFSAIGFSPGRVSEEVRKRMGRLQPEHVLIADAWYFKPALVKALAEWKPVVMLFTHEMMCIKGNGMLFRKGATCLRIRPVKSLPAGFPDRLSGGLFFRLQNCREKPLHRLPVGAVREDPDIGDPSVRRYRSIPAGPP